MRSADLHLAVITGTGPVILDGVLPSVVWHARVRISFPVQDVLWRVVDAAEEESWQVPAAR